MHGSVPEWCEDVRSEEFYSTPGAVRRDPLCTFDPLRPPSAPEVRVIRGGNYAYTAEHCRSARRGGGNTTRLNKAGGFVSPTGLCRRGCEASPLGFRTRVDMRAAWR